MSKGSNILDLVPFIDNAGLLRVGGRLKHADLYENKQHPILLPPKHPVTCLIIRAEYLRNLHAGPQAILYQLRQTYWIVNGKREINSVLKNC